MNYKHDSCKKLKNDLLHPYNILADNHNNTLNEIQLTTNSSKTGEV